MFKASIDLIFNKSFLIGLIFATCVLSKYIFGPDNLAEEVGELLIYIHSGQTIDFSNEGFGADNELIQKYKGLTNGNESISERN